MAIQETTIRRRDKQRLRSRVIAAVLAVGALLGGVSVARVAQGFGERARVEKEAASPTIPPAGSVRTAQR